MLSLIDALLSPIISKTCFNATLHPQSMFLKLSHAPMCAKFTEVNGWKYVVGRKMNEGWGSNRPMARLTRLQGVQVKMFPDRYHFESACRLLENAAAKIRGEQ